MSIKKAGVPLILGLLMAAAPVKGNAESRESSNGPPSSTEPKKPKTISQVIVAQCETSVLTFDIHRADKSKFRYIKLAEKVLGGYRLAHANSIISGLRGDVTIKVFCSSNIADILLTESEAYFDKPRMWVQLRLTIESDGVTVKEYARSAETQL